MTAWSYRYNFLGIIVGLPGDGKTTIVRKLIVKHLRETPGIVLAHDPLAQFTGVGCVRYPSVAAWRSAAAKAAKDKAPMPRGASIGGVTSAEDVTRLALELGEKLNRSERVEVPILVPYDERAFASDSGSTFMGKLDEEFAVTRRHRGLGGLLNVQDVAMLTQRWYRIATDVILFQMPSDRANALDEKLYLEKGTLVAAGVTRLAPHHYLRVQPRIGVVSEPL